MLSPGAAIGRYIIHKKLAEGGMAEVYLAAATGPEGFAKDVVIKVVRSFLASDQQFVDLFVAEARLSSRLNHANVVQIFDFGKADDSYYLAMEYVRGASLWELRKRCRERGVDFPPTLAADIASHVARGLQYAHTLTDRGQPLGLVHRDVTPHNVLLSFDGAIKLTDFGIAKASSSQTAPGMLKGKFAYMSPEQARGDLIDARTDVFALGIVLWELLTGGRLFEADSEVGVLRAVQSAQITPPDRLNPEVPEALSAIVLKALARPLNERFQTAVEFERALASFVLQTARSVDDTSSSRFVQQMFRQEYEAVNQPHVDEIGHGATLAVPRHQATATESSPHVSSMELTDPRGESEPLEQAVAPAKATDEMAGVRPSGRLKGSPVGVPPSQRPKTDLMPAHRTSRKISPPAPQIVPAPKPPSTEVDDLHELEFERALGRSLLRRRIVFAAVALMAAVVALGWFVSERTRENEPPAGGASPTIAGATGVGLAGPNIDDEPAEASVELARLEEPTAPDAALLGEQFKPPVPTASSPVTTAPERTKPIDAASAPVTTTPPERPKPTDAASAAKNKPVPVPVPLVTLEIRAVPYALLTIDGRDWGEVIGTRRLRLSAGVHELTLKHPRTSRDERVLLRPGESQTISFTALPVARDAN